MARVKPHCCLCMRELLPADDIILTDSIFIIHECCSNKNIFSEEDRGQFYEVVARHFPYFQDFVHHFNQLGLYR